MGTRGLTKVIKDGEVVVAQYGQWDHYPSGQGVDALNILRCPGNIDKLRDALPLPTLSDEERRKIVVEAMETNAEWVTLEQAAKIPAYLSRDIGAGILQLIIDGEVPGLYLDTDFEKDTLFCEGLITVDLDKNRFSWWGSYWDLDDLPDNEEFLSFFGEID